MGLEINWAFCPGLLGFKLGERWRFGQTRCNLCRLRSWLHVDIVKLTYNTPAAQGQNVKISLFHLDLILFKHIKHVTIDYNVSYLFSSDMGNVLVTMCFSRQLHYLTRHLGSKNTQ